MPPALSRPSQEPPLPPPGAPTDGDERRILVLAPTGNDAALTAQILTRAGIPVQICRNVGEVGRGVERPCAALLLAEEILRAGSMPVLVAALGRQPPWSDLPVIIITSGGEADQARLRRLAVFGPGSNVTLLERPFRPGTLLSTAESALRSRMRQYQVRDLLQNALAGEERLRDAGARRDLAIAAANLGEFDWNAADDSVALSPRAAEIFGAGSAPESARLRMRELLRGEDAERARLALAKSIETRTDYDVEYRLDSPDGRQRWVATKGRGIYAPDGPILGMVGVNQDITQRKQEEILRGGQIHILQLMAEDRPLTEVLDALIETVERVAAKGAAAAVMLLDANGRRLWFGAGRHLPQRFVRALDGIALGPANASAGAAAAAKSPVYVADIASDPHWRDWKDLAIAEGLRACWSTPIVGAGDQLLGVFEIYHPVSRQPRRGDLDAVETATRLAAVAIERKRTTAALSAHARRMGLLSDSAGQLLLAETPRGLLGGIFGRFAQELGAEIYFLHRMAGDGSSLTLENAVGLTARFREEIAQLMGPGGPGAAVVQSQKACSAGSLQQADAPQFALLRAWGMRAFACYPLKAERRLLGLVSFASKSRDEFGEEDLRSLATLCDLVAASMERARLLGEVSSARDAAEKASRAKDDFLAALSHELRTPLNPVLLLASEAAANPEIAPELRTDFDTIAKNIQLEARLIDDLLDLTRITRGKLLLDIRPTALHGVLEDAIANVKADVEDKHLKLTLELSAADPIVECDPVRLQQVFWNVLKNAAKFTEAQGEITVRTRARPEGGPVVVEIADTGAGMTAAEIGRIFDAFAQGDHAAKATSHRFGGLGLGLAITRTLVNLHSGSIRASSPGRGRGSTFTIELPQARSLPAPEPRPAVSPALRHGRDPAVPGLRILLVEDHGPTRAALAQLLNARNHSVVAASSLVEARNFGTTQPFDLLISDIGLPDGSGYELMAELGKSRGLKGIALSGYGADHDLELAQKNGFVAHLTKPVSIRTLDEVLNSVMAPPF